MDGIACTMLAVLVILMGDLDLLDILVSSVVLAVLWSLHVLAKMRAVARL
jgi:hypothetical protein